MKLEFQEQVFDQYLRLIAERPYAFERLFVEGQEYRIGEVTAEVISCTRIHNSLVVTKLHVPDPYVFRNLRGWYLGEKCVMFGQVIKRGVKCALRFVFGIPEKVEKLKKWSQES
jgi:hypothetical protein